MPRSHAAAAPPTPSPNTDTVSPAGECLHAVSLLSPFKLNNTRGGRKTHGRAVKTRGGAWAGHRCGAVPGGGPRGQLGPAGGERDLLGGERGC